MNRLKIFILLFTLISLNITCVFNKSTVYYENDDKTYAICGTCKALKKINSNVKYVEAYDKKCIIPASFSELTNIEKLLIMADDIDFANHTMAMDSLQLLVIHDNIFTEIPQFIYESKKIDWLLLNLEDGNAIKEELKNLENVKYLKLIFNELEAFPKPLLSLSKLEELHIEVLNGELIELSKDFSNLQKLKLVELPIDASKNLDILASLPNCNEFLLKGFSDIDGHLTFVGENFALAEQFYISEISRGNMKKLAESLPDVKPKSEDTYR